MVVFRVLFYVLCDVYVSVLLLFFFKEMYETKAGALTETMVKMLCRVLFMGAQQVAVALRVLAAKDRQKDAERALAAKQRASGVEAKVKAYVKGLGHASGKNGEVVIPDLQWALKNLALRGLDRRGNKPRLVQLLWEHRVSRLPQVDDAAPVVDDELNRAAEAEAAPVAARSRVSSSVSLAAAAW